MMNCKLISVSCTQTYLLEWGRSGVRAEFFENLKPMQQKGRRVPISLQEKVDKEFYRLIDEGRVVKLQECSNKYFVSPIVITVKKDGSIKQRGMYILQRWILHMRTDKFH